MIKCWVIGKRVARSAHRALHRVHHHYHRLIVKILAPAIVCVSTVAGLAPWLTPSASAPADRGPQPASYPAFAQPAPLPEITLPPNVGEIPPELITVDINSPITSFDTPPEIVHPVPEPSTMLLLTSAILVLFGLVVHRNPSRAQ